MISDALILMLQSDMHRQWYIHDLERLIIPAMLNNKLLIMYDGTRPTGLFTYAFLPKDVRENYTSGEKKLPVNIWSNGPKDGILYVIDFIAPYRNALKLGRFVQKSLTERYLETYPHDGAYFIRQAQGKRQGYATGVPAELEIRRFCCAV
jgi:hemolysin-activating ACP:hemolysin acyltransferase